MFTQPKTEDFVPKDLQLKDLMKEGEKEQIQEWLDTYQNISIKEGIEKILNEGDNCETLTMLYYKCLTQLKRMYDLCKAPDLPDINKSTGSMLPKCRMQYSKEILQLRLLEMCHFLPKEMRELLLPTLKFEYINNQWDSLYFRLWKLKIIHSIDVKYLMGMCISLKEYNTKSLEVVHTEEEKKEEGIWIHYQLKMLLF